MHHQRLDQIIDEVKSYVWSTQRDDCYWLYAPFLGPSFVSFYYLSLRYLNSLHLSKFDPSRLAKILIDTQSTTDGGWLQVPDVNNTTSNVDATVVNYWFLKSSQSLSTSSTILKRARQFILDRGGLDSCTHMTKIWLALFGQFNWNELASIPLFVFKDHYGFQKVTFVRNMVGQWVYPHVLAIAYLRHWRIQKDLGSDFDLSELRVTQVQIPNFKVGLHWIFFS
jgi:squalene-hopene/tetraprenyl-beta-curcumene cyclase